AGRRGGPRRAGDDALPKLRRGENLPVGREGARPHPRRRAPVGEAPAHDERRGAPELNDGPVEGLARREHVSERALAMVAIRRQAPRVSTGRRRCAWVSTPPRVLDSGTPPLTTAPATVRPASSATTPRTLGDGESSRQTSSRLSPGSSQSSRRSVFRAPSPYS